MDIKELDIEILFIKCHHPTQPLLGRVRKTKEIGFPGYVPRPSFRKQNFPH